MARTRTYSTPEHQHKFLSLGGIARWIAVATMCVAFFMSGLHLRFALSDLHQETRALQRDKMKLAGEINRLRSQVESYKAGDGLLQRAETELGMVEYAPTDWERVTVSADLQNDYREARLAFARSERRTALEERSLAVRVAQSLSVVGVAFADEVER